MERNIEKLIHILKELSNLSTNDRMQLEETMIFILESFLHCNPSFSQLKNLDGVIIANAQSLYLLSNYKIGDKQDEQV